MFVSTIRGTFAALFVVLCATPGAAAPVPAERAKAEKEQAAVAAKLQGEWLGGPCDGRLTFRADGTYEWRGAGPVPNVSSGKWAIRGGAQSPVLVWKCAEADDEELIGKTVEMPLVRLDGAVLVLKCEGLPEPRHFERVKN
ncbi:unnamed protein product [Gemmata massiliana]|uniref:Uncharacterized protein n=1 Tax=Gemmata massiliana TaxID=1210884 RepID=A0A6P2CU37_9BACT|nr:hypothetical protein [Gemmata massiliana]VTR91896.1 unnamed protein product [Gemmata massiliana]